MQIINSNCLDVLQKVIDNNKKVDCIITSPSYNLCLRIHNGK